jgi:predicted transcriptional regulator
MELKRRFVAGRPIGTLEAEVLERLWDAGRPVSVREVAAALSGEARAYTTVTTILSRLLRKGLVRRLPIGRGFLYAPAGSEEELAALAIRRLLDASRDPRAVLTCFVGQISSEEPELLRHLARLVEQEARLVGGPPPVRRRTGKDAHARAA